MIRHTLFSLPFALAAVLLESRGEPSAWKLLWILLAATGGRNAANAVNRIVDRDIDAKNPRTAGRPLPSGRLGAGELKLFAAAMLALLLLSASMLNWLCLASLPIAGVAIFGYSYMKRMTWLCHYWLGATCAIASMGSFIALTGTLEIRYFVYSSAVALWVGGFDILYAIQDIEVDRAQGLKSVPARFGEGLARLAAVASHLGTIGAFGLAPLFWPLGIAYWAALGLAATLLAAEHLVALGRSERHIRVAAYGINEIVPLVVLAGVAVDIYLI
jgi:4-hydroxybenzoate polyprenyltransferase